RAYVSNLTPVVGQGSIGFAPSVSTIGSGVVLDVQATVSADRKFVTLTLRPTLTRVLDIFNFAFATASANLGTGTGGTGGLGTGTTQAISSATGIIQQPEQQETSVRTSVSVPDGGTLLLGG